MIGCWALGMLTACSNSMTKLLKNPDPAYKLRMAEQFFAKEQYIIQTHFP